MGLVETIGHSPFCQIDEVVQATSMASGGAFRLLFGGKIGTLSLDLVPQGPAGPGTLLPLVGSTSPTRLSSWGIPYPKNGEEGRGGPRTSVRMNSTTTSTRVLLFYILATSLY